MAKRRWVVAGGAARLHPRSSGRATAGAEAARHAAMASRSRKRISHDQASQQVPQALKHAMSSLALAALCSACSGLNSSYDLRAAPD